jgi:hypothetical protein
LVVGLAYAARSCAVSHWGRLLGVIDLARTTFVIALLIAGLAPRCFPQSQGAESNDFAADSRNALMSAINAEEKKGAVLNYAQSYRSEGKPVSIQGTIYAGITTVALNGCELSIATTIVDRYAGQVEKSLIQNTQSFYNYSGELVLTREIADGARLVGARPSLLERGTHPLCADGRACAIDWVEFQAEKKVMKLTSITNDIAGYDGMVRNFDGVVDRLWIPVSSEQAGTELIKLFKSLAATCDR